jgi:hypothetical protein
MALFLNLLLSLMSALNPAMTPNNSHGAVIDSSHGAVIDSSHGAVIDSSHGAVID